MAVLKRFCLHQVDGKVYVEHKASGERWAEVLGNVGVNRLIRAQMIADALEPLLRAPSQPEVTIQ